MEGVRVSPSPWGLTRGDEETGDEPVEILNLSESGAPKPQKSRAVRAVFGAALIAGVATLSSTLAANININSGPVEFGQGVAQTVSCGDSEVPIIVTPSSSFTNSDGGAFAMSSITLSDIPSACNGKVFTIKVYDNSNNEPLSIGTLPGAGAADTSVQVWWGSSYIPTAADGGVTDVPQANTALLNFPTSVWQGLDTDAKGSGGAPLHPFIETANSPDGTITADNSFKVILPTPIDATQVYKITLETQDDSPLILGWGPSPITFYDAWYNWS